MKINILMSTYNGEKFLREQLDSLLSQKLPNNYDMRILVRDDGSTDQTLNILEEYKKRGELDYYSGSNIKSARSFWELVCNCDDADYYAFCDQDDVWFDDKIARAVFSLQKEENEGLPLLYCSNITLTDDKLNPLPNQYKKENANTTFAHSLIYSIAQGCTMVFNHCARMKFVQYDMENNFVVMHDWLAHKIAAMFGKVIYDPEPTEFYRQHENNVVGASVGGKIRQLINQIKRMLGDYDSVRSNVAKSLLNVYGDKISAENKHLLNMVGFYKKDKKLRKSMLKSQAFGHKNKFFYKLAVRLKKI